MSSTSSGGGRRGPLRVLWRAVRRPSGSVEGMRWLYAVSAVLALLLSLPAALSEPTRTTVVLTAAGTVVLVLSWSGGYLARRSPVVLDVVDAVAIAAIAVSCSEPAVVFSFAFSGLWFRSLYGSVPRAVVRCAVYAAGISSCLALWPLVHPGVPAPAAAPLLGTFPVMFIVVVVGRLLGASLFAREQAAQRDAALVAAGSAVLSTTDREEVLAAAGAGCVGIAAATPGLRLVAVTRRGDRLVVDGTAGDLLSAPSALPGTVLGIGTGTGTGDDSDSDSDSDSGEAVAVLDAAPLDAAVGRRCAWVCVPLPDSVDSWMLFGAPREVPEEAVLAVRALMNQVTLALRNSQVHAELTAQARTDALTGLPNRAAFQQALDAAAAADGDGAVVLFIDLDGFKAVNDRLGHRAGDALLREVAVRLSGTTRAQDTCARLGGDEFAVLLPGTSAADAEAVAPPAPRTPAPASAATSSPSCCPPPARPTPRRSPSGCARPSPRRSRSTGTSSGWAPASASPLRPPGRTPTPSCRARTPRCTP